MNGNTTPLRILVAEDHDVSRFILSKCMNRPEWKVEFVRSGREAINQSAGKAYDIIMLDIELPDLNGYQVAEMIRSRKEQSIRNVPIIAMTGHSTGKEISRSIQAGMNGHLTKPFSGEQLNTCIQSIMQHTSTTGDGNPVEPDLSFLREVASGDLDFMCTFIGMFLKEIPDSLDRLSNAIEKAEWETIRSVSHKMKSSLLYAGLKDQNALSAQIEKRAAERNHMDLIRRDFSNLKNGCASSYEGLRASLLLLQNQTSHERR